MVSGMAETHVETSGRRRFTVEEKHRIVAEYSAADSPSGRGEVLRRWGTFQQNVSRWRRQIEAGTLGGGSKGLSGEERARFKSELKRSNARLEKARAENETLKALIRAQGKALGPHAEQQPETPPG